MPTEVEYRAAYIAAVIAAGHKPKLDEDGKPDIMAYAPNGHNGPECETCGWHRCMWCNEDLTKIPACSGERPPRVLTEAELLRARVAELEGALRDNAMDCDSLASQKFVKPGERAAYEALATQLRKALSLPGSGEYVGVTKAKLAEAITDLEYYSMGLRLTEKGRDGAKALIVELRSIVGEK